MASLRDLSSASGVRGVYPSDKHNRWRVRIVVGSKKINLGTYDTIEEAAAVYNSAAIRYFGEAAFTEEGDQNEK